MKRLADVTREAMSPEQEALYRMIVSGKRGSGQPPEHFFNAGGGMRGPFNPWMYHPRVGAAVQRVGEAIRFEGVLPDRVRELAILAVAARWRSQFEWFSHERIARSAGLPEEIIAALHQGRDPQPADPTEAAAYRFTRELLETRQVGDALYREAVAALGEQGTVELVTLLGYYTLISMTLNVFRVPVPEGEEPPFAP